MKKNSLFSALLLLLIGSVTLSAQQKPDKPVFKAETAIAIDRKTFNPGEKIPVKIICTYPAETYQVGSWRLFAYLPDIPEGFAQMPGFKVIKRKDPRWSSVDVKQGAWFHTQLRKNKEFKVEINTANWPEGDYRMNINICFQPLVKGEKYEYHTGTLSFTIEK